MVATNIEDPVLPEDRCPRCGERDTDLLVWLEDGERVRCSTCGHTYRPPAAGPSDSQS